MSFSLTTPQFIARTKTVTRRLAWWQLKPGDVLEGVEKAMGLKRGEKVKRLGKIRIVSARAEALNWITPEDVVREGFPHLTPAEFVMMYRLHHHIEPDRFVNRIEFEYIDQESCAQP